MLDLVGFEWLALPPSLQTIYNFPTQAMLTEASNRSRIQLDKVGFHYIQRREVRSSPPETQTYESCFIP